MISSLTFHDVRFLTLVSSPVLEAQMQKSRNELLELLELLAVEQNVEGVRRRSEVVDLASNFKFPFYDCWVFRAQGFIKQTLTTASAVAVCFFFFWF